MTDETERAFRAYFRGAPESIDQPGRRDSGPATVDGKRYIVLRNVRGTLAVYRLSESGALRRQTYWPEALDTF